jgi:hypothetical protein
MTTDMVVAAERHFAGRALTPWEEAQRAAGRCIGCGARVELVQTRRGPRRHLECRACYGCRAYPYTGDVAPVGMAAEFRARIGGGR